MTTDPHLLRQWDNEHVWHPFTPMQAYRDEHAPIIERGEGFHLIDVEGHRYLDGISSLWCNVHGHCVPEIDQAVQEQLQKIAHSTMLGLSSPPSIELAKKLVDATPEPLTKVFYTDSGSTAVEAALKIAYQYQHQKQGGSSERNLFATVSGAYHGDTIGSVSVGSIELFHRVYGKLLFETVHVPSPISFGVPDGMTVEQYRQHCFDAVTQVIEANHQRLAAFVIEPLVQGAAGILVHPLGYLKHVREVTARYGIPLIADEVAVGFGRTGTMFACEQEEVAPDIMCLAKGLTGGYFPVAATLATDEIFEAFLAEPTAGKTFYHGHTYTGHPLGCAAGVASFDLFQQNDLLAHIKQSEQIIVDKLTAIQNHPNVGQVRQMGILVGIELVADRDGPHSYPAEKRIGHQVTLAARSRGLIIRPLGDVIVLMPAPAMPHNLIEELCDTAIESIEEVTSAA